MKVDILYLAFNRLQFTTATWAWLLAQTNFDLVNKIVVYDDGSEDGTQEFLKDQADIKHPVPVELRIGDFRSPPAIMNHYISTSQADAFAKLDNDIAVPGGWLDKLVSVMGGNPELELLGMEAGMVAMQGRDGNTWEHYTYEPCTHIGGVGLMRVSAFKDRPSIPFRGRFGFSEWQARYEPVRAWIKPDIDCPQLDRVPEEPWMSLAEEYVEKGWSRPWGLYDPAWCKPYYSWLTADEGGTLEAGR